MNSMTRRVKTQNPDLYNEIREEAFAELIERMKKIPVVCDQDGSGCDSGDPLDLIVTEITLAIEELQEKAQKVRCCFAGSVEACPHHERRRVR